MSDHELALGRGAMYAADPDLSPAAHMAAIAEAYAATAGAHGDRRDLYVHDLLERAALEGRQPPEPEDCAGHEPVPPTLRCQQCGLPITLVLEQPPDDWDQVRWTHVLGSDDGQR